MPLMTIRSSRCRPVRTTRKPRSRLPGVMAAPLGDVVLAHDPDEAQGLIAQNRAVGHEHRIVLTGAEEQEPA